MGRRVMNIVAARISANMGLNDCDTAISQAKEHVKNDENVTYWAGISIQADISKRHFEQVLEYLNEGE
jgi:hypothetical protein